MFDRFSFPMMYVKELDRAIQFYCDILGFTPNFVSPDAYASLRHEKMGCRLDLHPVKADPDKFGFGPVIYFAAQEFDAVVDTLKNKGVKVGEPRREGEGGSSPRFVSFWDSEGNELGIEEI